MEDEALVIADASCAEEASSIQSVQDGLAQLSAMQAGLEALAIADGAGLSAEARQASTIGRVQNAVAKLLADIEKQNADLLPSIKDLWNALVSESLFKLPVYYATDQLGKLLTGFTQSLRRLPTYNPGSGGSICLYGVRGVGKSTLLRFMYALCSLLYPTYGIFMYSLDQGGSVPKLSEIIGSHDEKRPLVLLLDELHLVYEHPDVERAVEFIRDLRAFAKQAKAKAVITGSSARLHDMMFNNSKSGKQWKDRGFPDLNDTVFASRRLDPIRDLKEFKEYLQGIRPELTAVAEEVLAKTGGVSRLVQSYDANDNQELPHRRQLILTLQQEQYFLRFATFLLSRPSPQDACGLKVVFGDELVVVAAEHLQSWLDNGLVFVKQDVYIELLIPEHIKTLKRVLLDDPDERLKLALRVVRHDWVGGSPGTQAEPYIFGRYFETPSKLVTAEISQAQSKYMFGTQPLAKVRLDNLACEPFRLTFDNGVDCCRLIQSEQGWEVFCLQLKLGKPSCRITPGVLETQRKNRNTKGVKVDDTTLAGIIAKGERGCETLLKILQTVFPDHNFKISTFTLLTCKDAPVPDVTWNLKVNNQDVPFHVVSGSSFWSAINFDPLQL
eukprot:c16679_g1_i1.p1 GENE.c16679_g1_i1~~c16679_g1_i1.p1  ORF type:complete len:632 (+),score=94.17 c16679_g1_i1:61-1896(+)